jgi:hypothetical protein
MAEQRAERLDGEARAVFQWRFDQARTAGLTMVEAARFAENGVDVGQLRRLVELGCRPRVIADIVT